MTDSWDAAVARLLDGADWAAWASGLLAEARVHDANRMRFEASSFARAQRGCRIYQAVHPDLMNRLDSARTPAELDKVIAQHRALDEVMAAALAGLRPPTRRRPPATRTR